MKALLIIDMLRDFVNADGALPVPGADALVWPINREIKICRDKGAPTIFVCDAHDEDDREFLAWPKHAIDKTEGAQVIDALDKREGDIVIKKKRYSAFYGTGLEEVLKERGVDTLVLTGGPHRHMCYAHRRGRRDEELQGDSAGRLREIRHAGGPRLGDKAHERDLA